jgi:hypothetical protein
MVSKNLTFGLIISLLIILVVGIIIPTVQIRRNNRDKRFWWKVFWGAGIAPLVLWIIVSLKTLSDCVGSTLNGIQKNRPQQPYTEPSGAVNNGLKPPA